MKTILPTSKTNLLKPPVPGIMKTFTRATFMAIVTVAILFLNSTISLAQFPFNLDGGSSGKKVNCVGVVRDANNNVYVLGNFMGTVNFDPAGGTHTPSSILTPTGTSYSIFIASYTASGVYQWAIRMGGTGAALTTGEKISVDASGNLYITGLFSTSTVNFDPLAGTHTPSSILTNSGSDDIYVASYTSAGVYRWAFKVGSTTLDIGYGIATDASGNVLVTGRLGGTANFDPAGGTHTPSSTLTRKATTADIFVAKYSSAGVYQWAFNIGDPAAATATAFAITTDASNNVLVTGIFNGSPNFDPAGGTHSPSSTLAAAAPGSDYFVAKYDPSGNYLWAFNLNNGNGIFQLYQGIATDANNNVLITGGFNGTANFQGTSVTSEPLSSAGTNNSIYLAKYNSSGNYQWALNLGNATNACDGQAVIADASGNVYASGYFGGSVNFNPSGSANVSSLGTQDLFVASYTSTGAYQWAFGAGNASENGDDGWALAMDGCDNVLVAGTFNGATNFNPSGPAVTLTSTGSSDGFAARYTSTGALWQPLNLTGEPSAPAAVCAGTGSASFTISVTGSDLSYQWQECNNPSSCTWANITNGGVYSGALTATLTLTDPSYSMNGYKYLCVVSQGCPTSSVTSDGNEALTVNPAPSAPVATAGTSITGTSFTANWNSVGSATGYFLDVATDNGFVGMVAGYNNLSVSGTSQSVTGLNGLTTYYYRARAINSFSCTSANSNTIALTTPCPPIVTPTAIASGGTGPAPNIVICSGTTTTMVLTNYNGTIQWQSSADGETNWVSVVGGSGATTATYTTSNLTTTTYYRALVSGCYTIASNTIVVSVSAAPVITLTNVTPTSVSASWTPFAVNSSVLYTLTYSGSAGSGTINPANSPQAINGLTSGSTLDVTVNQVNPAGCTTSSNASINTTLAAPTLTLGTATAHGFTASWTTVPGATSYTLYYRSPNINGGFSTITTSASPVVLTGLNIGTFYLAYVTANEAGYTGTASTEQYITTLPNSNSCATPTFSVASNCSNQLTITMSGSPSGIYRFSIIRISPNPSAGASYTVSGGTVNVTVGSQFASSIWQVLVSSNCSGVISEIADPQYVVIKPACPALQNLVLSTPDNCHGFEATWNAGTCISPENYYLFVQRQGTVGYVAYPVGTNNYVNASWLGAYTWNAYITQVGCNTTISPASTIQTINTGVGCRTEEQVQADNTPINDVEQGNAAMNIYPNPTNGNFMVNVYTKNKPDETIQIEMVNTLGQVVFTVIAPVTNGISNNAFQVPGNVSSGMYLIRTVAGGENMVKQVIYAR